MRLPHLGGRPMDVLERLHADHVNFAKVLNLLVEQLEVLRNGDAPDYDLILDILYYIKDYPDLIHHPAEEVVFAVYLERHSEHEQTIRRLSHEHQELKERTDQLYLLAEGVAEDQVFSKQDFEEQIADFIHQQRHHMAIEEGEIYPALKARLSRTDLERVDTDLRAQQDPLFGDTVHQQYQSLYQRITGQP